MFKQYALIVCIFVQRKTEASNNNYHVTSKKIAQRPNKEICLLTVEPG
jgi:hypothetical protein